MAETFSIGEALAAPVRVIRRHPLAVFVWGLTMVVFSLALSAGDRCRARTCQPRATSIPISRPPRNPVPPVTNAFAIVSSLRKFDVTDYNIRML